MCHPVLLNAVLTQTAWNHSVGVYLAGSFIWCIICACVWLIFFIVLSLALSITSTSLIIPISEEIMLFIVTLWKSFYKCFCVQCCCQFFIHLLLCTAVIIFFLCILSKMMFLQCKHGRLWSLCFICVLSFSSSSCFSFTLSVLTVSCGSQSSVSMFNVMGFESSSTPHISLCCLTSHIHCHHQ